MKKYPHIFLTLFLGIGLCFPFVLKLKNPGLEMFPAVIFPSGAKLSGNYVQKLPFISYRFYGVGDSIEELDKKMFLRGLPSQYFGVIKQAGFGLEEYKGESKLYKPPMKFKVKNDFTPETLRETKKWFRKRLQEQGVRDSIFFVREYRVTYDVEEKVIECEELLDEKSYRVD